MNGAIALEIVFISHFSQDEISFELKITMEQDAFNSNEEKTRLSCRLFFSLFAFILVGRQRIKLKANFNSTFQTEQFNCNHIRAISAIL